VLIEDSDIYSATGLDHISFGVWSFVYTQARSRRSIPSCERSE
jgi:hypothetical protein